MCHADTILHMTILTTGVEVDTKGSVPTKGEKNITRLSKILSALRQVPERTHSGVKYEHNNADISNLVL